MFKTANDTRSNLILNALSWVDHYRPRYVYFENVTGFLSFHPNARQAGVHRLEGGVTMGGLKLLIRALLEMGYVSKNKSLTYTFMILTAIRSDIVFSKLDITVHHNDGSDSLSLLHKARFHSQIFLSLHMISHKFMD